ncbi:hypothetical protein NTE_03426 [Candidatus Nitrososphaera evergladensis SR1]|uniref:Uncharacterized protein n=1 Tax=Candidatus Nitrososphaera evergladensis SR1 TaxID=1459636 RepID=A0A075N1X4_9ARCH|nr:hypothetical protein NTE_03426 [Candidatus Nitrososphaera evergladensis SR1]
MLSSTGWSFYARKTTSTGFITQQQYTVGSPCDSASNQMRLRISYDVSTQSWVVSFTHATGALNSKSFPAEARPYSQGLMGTTMEPT